MTGINIGGSAVSLGIGVPYAKTVGALDSIWYVPVAGGTPVQVTVGTSLQQETPIVDPAGRTRLVYLQRITGGDLNLRIVNGDGSGDALVDSGHHRILDWKPDGSKIMFTSFNTGEEHQIFEIEPDGSNRTAIYSATPGDYLNRPRYSPDGSQIAFFRNPGGGSSGSDEVWVMDSDGTNANMLDTIFDGYSTDNAVSWSPDGTQIAYGDGGHIAGAGSWGHWYVIDADGTNKTDVGSQDGPDDTANAYGSRAMWVPAGDAIIVDYWTDDPRWSLARCASDGGGLALLSPTVQIVDRPDLFFENGRLYCEPYIDPPPSSGTDLESVEADGSDRRVEDSASAVDILLEFFE